MDGLRKPWSEDQVLVSRVRRIQTGHKSVVRVVIKFIKDEGGCRKKTAVGLARWKMGEK
jgi:hypothetical protein